MYIKVCGITKPDQAVAIAAMEIDALGFICVPYTPRYVDCEQIRCICDLLPASVDRVGVFLDASLPEIHQIIQRSGLNCVQLHGKESLQFCQALRSAIPNVKLIKAFRIQTKEDLEQARAYVEGTDAIDAILLDAYDPKLAGGTGRTINWDILTDFRPTCHWLLAGGLTPENVAIALEQLHPDGIDISSGVEIAPGNKDIGRVRKLIHAVRQPLAI
ncbi:phosphoribosylanthranilate isomerase [Pseudanabaena sp. PCC 6802]|uniref:phosphoribosylanthranilate isomerase n=1 Tax=Pseudanabaena sp. PCC 6802 TaxID=118173 RepID=UPI0003467B0B|nr:phosphoribosylanthranilate isomerase [Pseudanabaena sp. PCC 6802]